MSDRDEDWTCTCGQSYDDHPRDCEASIWARNLVDRVERKVFDEIVKGADDDD